MCIRTIRTTIKKKKQWFDLAETTNILSVCFPKQGPMEGTGNQETHSIKPPRRSGRLWGQFDIVAKLCNYNVTLCTGARNAFPMGLLLTDTAVKWWAGSSECCSAFWYQDLIYWWGLLSEDLEEPHGAWPPRLRPATGRELSSKTHCECGRSDDC